MWAATLVLKSSRAAGVTVPGGGSTRVRTPWTVMVWRPPAGSPEASGSPCSQGRVTSTVRPPSSPASSGRSGTTAVASCSKSPSAPVRKPQE